VNGAPFIGILSDTHGHYDAVLDDLFVGAERIVHAGDIGAGVLERLSRLAPVTAVLGNTDSPQLLPGVPWEAEVECLGLRIVVAHIRESLWGARDPVAQGFDLVVTGHSHRPSFEWSGGTMMLNPGAAGRARFGLPRSAALVVVEGGRPRAQIVTLE
jgi:putative phosphoesterase